METLLYQNLMVTANQKSTKYKYTGEKNNPNNSKNSYQIIS